MPLVVDWVEVAENFEHEWDFFDEFLCDFAKEFRTRRRIIGVALNNHDIPLVLKEVHSLKGTASYLHCRKFTESCDYMKTDCSAKQWNNICMRFVQLMEILKARRGLHTHTIIVS